MMSKIFEWYGRDFGKTQKEMLQYLLPYLEGNIHNQIKNIFESNMEIKIRFKTYDWAINHTPTKVKL
jgi:hypothetical protein